MKKNRPHSGWLWIVAYCLLGQAFAQSTSELCTDALMEKVSTQTGRTSVILLDSTRTYAVSASEEGLRGTGSLRVMNQSTRPLTFDCRVNTRFRSVISLDLGETTGGGRWPSRPVPPPPPGGAVGDSPCSLPTLYADDSLRGQSLALDRSVDDLQNENFGDEASSVCVPYGWRVVLYSDNGYRGDRLEISGPGEIQDLKRDRPGGLDWGDRASSIEVLRVQPDTSLPATCGSVPTLYSDDGLEGGSLQLKESRADLHREGFGDRASSVCVPSGWTLELFSDTDYRGDRLLLRGPVVISDLKRDQPDGRDWGDRISSARVSAAGFRFPNQ